jgi:menaquinone-9 beta-reductase
MNNDQVEDLMYDVAIIGGGLGGLALAIQSVQQGYRTILFEKEKYPFHRVCGEYISFESWNFLQELGIPLSDLHLPLIRRLQVSAPNGNMLEHTLPLGGFGISRYYLDDLLHQIAIKEGVVVMQENRVMDVIYSNDRFTLFTNRGETTARVVAGAYGKRSNLDIRWKREFTRKRPGKLNHFIGIKYHVSSDLPSDLISLHNFKNGYCGVSQVENNKYCLCYLTTAANLRNNQNDVLEMERNVLMKNPLLKEVLLSSTKLFEQPLIISQISFNRRSQVENHVLMVGDCAGLITPLCGNGMSMALHASKLAIREIESFLAGNTSRFEMEQQYEQQWEKHFSRRLATGRMIQRWFGSEFQSDLLIKALKPFPKLVNFLIRETHGETF